MADGSSLYTVGDDQILDAAWFNKLLGDIHTRIRTIEGVKASLDAAIGELTAVGLKRIDEALAPLILQAQTDVANIEEHLADVAQQIADLLAGGVPAANVTESATQVFVTPEQRAQIQATATALAALQQGVTDSVNALTTAVNARAMKDNADLTGAPAFVTVITPAALVADQNDYAPANLHTAMTLRLAAASPRTLTGLHAGRDGEFKLIDNVGSADITLASESALSAAANRLALGVDHTLRSGQSLMLRYEASSARWRAVANATRSQVPTGMRAQFYVPPPPPWIPLTGGTALIASYPQMASFLGATPSAASIALQNATYIQGAIFPGVNDTSWSPYQFSKGLGFYWAVFVQRSNGSGAYTFNIRVYRSASATTGFALVYSETNFAAADAANGESYQSPSAYLGSRGIAWSDTYGVFTFGNSIFTLEAAAPYCTKLNGVLTVAGGYNGLVSKTVTWSGAEFLIMETDLGAYYNATAASVHTSAAPKTTWTFKGRGPIGNSDYVTVSAVVFAFGQYWALNTTASNNPPLYVSATGYSGWTAAPGFSAYGSSYYFRYLKFDGKALYLLAGWNGGNAGTPRRTLDGLNWSNPSGPGGSSWVLPVKTPTWSGVVSYSPGTGATVLNPAGGTGNQIQAHSTNDGAALSANSEYLTLLDEAGGRLVSLIQWNTISSQVFTINPMTMFALPDAATTPPTYAYGV